MDLFCEEILLPEFKFSEASDNEIKLLKPLTNILDKSMIKIRNGEIYFERLYFVAGGYAAYVAGKTNTYDDIDIYTNATYHVRRLTYDEYPDRMIKYIANKYPYQFIHIGEKFGDIQKFVKKVLYGFDLDICSIAYWLDGGKFFKMERIKDMTAKDLIRIRPDRLDKYIKRSKFATSLKLQSLKILLNYFDLNDVNILLNKIDMKF